MDQDIKRIINRVFSVDDSKVVEKMLELVNKDMSDVNRAKRINNLDYILSGTIE